MAIFASTTLGSSDPSRAMSIKALEARAQALAAAQAKQEVPQSVPSPWQGIGNLANTAADAFASRRADQAAAQRRQDLAGYIAQAGDNPTAAQIGQISAADPDLGKTYLTEIQQRRLQAERAKADEAYQSRTIGAQKEAAAQKTQADLEYLREQERLHAQRPPTAPEIKARTDQEKAHAEAQSYVNTMEEAKDLVNQGVYSGKGAEYRGEYGKGLTGYATDLIGVTDPETTKRDDRYNKIMNTAATAMTAAMKGSQSEKELALALDTARNPSSTKEAKLQALEVIIRLGKAHSSIAEQAVKDMKGKPTYLEPYQPGSSLVLKGSGGAAPAAAGATAAPAAGGDPKEKARQAIAAGAPRDKVIERLKQAGIDPSGL